MAFNEGITYTGPFEDDGEDVSGNALNAVVMQFGVIADRPAAGNAGVRFYATNTGVEYYDNGTNWIPLPSASPPGSLIDFAGNSIPDGYLECAGGAISRSTYAALFSAIGTRWGAGNGTTTFNLPDLRRRVTIGAGGTQSAGPGTDVGDTGGSERVQSEVRSHTHSGPSHTHTGPSHTHSGPAHTHPYMDESIGLIAGGGGGRVPSSTVGFVDTDRTTSSGGTGATGSGGTGVGGAGGTGNTGNAGGSAYHDNVQPSAVVRKLIRV